MVAYRSDRVFHLTQFIHLDLFLVECKITHLLYSIVYFILTPDECKITHRGEDYTGLLDYTKTGRWCIKWTDPRLSQYGFLDADFPDGSVVAADKFCRNPDGADVGPYCYNDNAEKELCDVPFCSELLGCFHSVMFRSVVSCSGVFIL